MNKGESLGVLMREVRVRVVNISSVGTLLEGNKRMAVGTLGRLRLRFGDGEYVEDVEVVRCDAVEGAGVFHIGVRFLFTTSRHNRSIRGVLARFGGPQSVAIEETSRPM
ncbi:MAG TPA: PilZ domain-containing protein [Vicinamibacterales bacterium]|nr:PilZ domain-containing protein [Vicinamibacterales bacterium]